MDVRQILETKNDIFESKRIIKNFRWYRQPWRDGKILPGDIHTRRMQWPRLEVGIDEDDIPQSTAKKDRFRTKSQPMQDNTRRENPEKKQFCNPKNPEKNRRNKPQMIPSKKLRPQRPARKTTTHFSFTIFHMINFVLRSEGSWQIANEVTMVNNCDIVIVEQRNKSHRPVSSSISIIPCYFLIKRFNTIGVKINHWELLFLKL